MESDHPHEHQEQGIIPGDMHMMSHFFMGNMWLSAGIFEEASASLRPMELHRPRTNNAFWRDRYFSYIEDLVKGEYVVRMVSGLTPFAEGFEGEVGEEFISINGEIREVIGQQRRIVAGAFLKKVKGHSPDLWDKRILTLHELFLHDAVDGAAVPEWFFHKLQEETGRMRYDVLQVLVHATREDDCECLESFGFRERRRGKKKVSMVWEPQ